MKFKHVSFGEETFPYQKPKDRNECVLVFNDNKILNKKRYPANFQTMLARSLLENGSKQSSKGTTQEKLGEIGNEMKGDASEAIENNNIANEGNERETRTMVSTEPRYRGRQRKASVRSTVIALSRVR